MRRTWYAILVLGLLGGCGGAAPRRARTPPSVSPDAFAGQAPVFVLVGRVSYYHDSLAGNLTANGEVYDPRAFTAASRHLPFDTIVRVVRVDTGRSVIVRVNDRGPFGYADRILDLSRGAAEQIAMIRAGVVPVRAEIVRYGK